MSPLNDLHRRLYSHNNDDIVKREKSPDEYGDDSKTSERESDADNLNASQLPESPKPPEKEEQVYFEENPMDSTPGNNSIPDLKKEASKIKRKKFVIAGVALGFILLLIGGVIGYVKYKQGAFAQENVLIEFRGNQEVKSGQDFDYTLMIHNDNRVALEDTQIKIDYPSELTPVVMSYMQENTKNSFYINIGEIKANETKEYSLKFEVYSSRGNQAYLNADFRYQPANFSSVFSKEENHSIDVRGSIIDFSLVSQQEASIGELIKIVGVLNNNDVVDLENLIIEISFPDDFELKQTTLEKVSGSSNKFKIPIIKAQERLEVELVGGFNGQADSIRNVNAIIGVLDETSSLRGIAFAEESLRLIPSRIAISQSVVSGVDVDQTTKLGVLLDYKINFKNNSSSPLLDLVLKEEIDSGLIDTSTIKVGSGGYYNDETKEIIWKAADVPSLKTLNPGQGGMVEFEFKLKKDTVNKTNQSIITQAKISSLNVDTTLLDSKEIRSAKEEIKIATNLDVTVSGEYGEENSGPFPLKTGEETTLSLRVSMRNNLNTVENPNLTIKLPSGIIWRDNFYRSSGLVSFNERSNEIQWTLDSVNSQSGYTEPAEELTFQVGVTPQVNQSIGDIILVNSTEFKGFETFIERNIGEEVKSFKVNQIEDYEF